MKQAIGFTLVIFGLMVMAGSAGDCDGKCMEYANTMGEMLKISFFGFLAVAFGGYLVYSSSVK